MHNLHSWAVGISMASLNVRKSLSTVGHLPLLHFVWRFEIRWIGYRVPQKDLKFILVIIEASV